MGSVPPETDSILEFTQMSEPQAGPYGAAPAGGAAGSVYGERRDAKRMVQ